MRYNINGVNFINLKEARIYAEHICIETGKPVEVFKGKIHVFDYAWSVEDSKLVRLNA